MNGPEVYKFAVRKFPEVILQLTANAGIKPEDLRRAIDLIIPHQANLKIIEGSAKRLDLPMSMFYLNLDRYANTACGSAPLALDEAVTEGLIREGDRIIIIVFGAGLTWVACLTTWAYNP